MAIGNSALEWTPLPALPDPEGFAGMYAGTTKRGIIAAGGHHFEKGVPWWNGGAKVWSDSIYTLESPSGPWTIAQAKMPRALGDGVGVGYRDGIICAGGGDATQAYAEVFFLHWNGRQIEIRTLPSLPSPLLKMGGTVVEDVLYLVGGRDHPASTSALPAFFALDLSRPENDRRWLSLPTWPGPARMMPVVAAGRDGLYVFGGIEITSDSQGKPKNVAPYLTDAYCYRPGIGKTGGQWKKLADLPRPLAGAPSPAWLRDESTVMVFGGVDGAIEAITDRSSVRSLPADILAYNIASNEWTRAGRIPGSMFPRVNAPAVMWHGNYTIISGEHLPARRSNAVTSVRARPPGRTKGD